MPFESPGKLVNVRSVLFLLQQGLVLEAPLPFDLSPATTTTTKQFHDAVSVLTLHDATLLYIRRNEHVGIGIRRKTRVLP